MHATLTTLDPAAQLAAKINNAKSDAVDVLHKLMSRLSADLEAPDQVGGGEEGQPDRRPTASLQRVRLCFQIARELLRAKPPADQSDDTTNRSGRGTPRGVHAADAGPSPNPQSHSADDEFEDDEGAPDPCTPMSDEEYLKLSREYGREHALRQRNIRAHLYNEWRNHPKTKANST